MKQRTDAFGVRGWRVSWTDPFTNVRVCDVFYARTRTAARSRAARVNPTGKSFRVGPYHGGVQIPAYHAALT